MQLETSSVHRSPSFRLPPAGGV